jgi:hypothetical protein
MQGAIADAYQQTKATEFSLSFCTAFVSSKTQRCAVRDESGAIIFAADLKTGRIIKALSEENSAQFLEQILESPTPPQPKKSRSPAAVQL